MKERRLHDGAMIIRRQGACRRMRTASETGYQYSKVIWDQTQSRIGITENSDALPIALWKKPNNIHRVEGPSRFDIKTVEKELLKMYLSGGRNTPMTGVGRFIDKIRGKKDAKQ